MNLALAIDRFTISPLPRPWARVILLSPAAIHATQEIGRAPKEGWKESAGSSKHSPKLAIHFCCINRAGLNKIKYLDVGPQAQLPPPYAEDISALLTMALIDRAL